MNPQSTSQFSENFIKQIDCQLEGDFVSLAKTYQHVTGHPFDVKYNNNALFSMLEQALMTEDKSLLTSTVAFLETLPVKLQNEFQAFSRRSHRSHALTSKHSHASSNDAKTNTSVVDKLCRLLHLKSAA